MRLRKSRVLALSTMSGGRNFSSDLRRLQGLKRIRTGVLGAPEGVKGETGRGEGVTRINSSVAASLNLLCLASAKFVQAHSSMFINRGIVFPLFARDGEEGRKSSPRFTNNWPRAAPISFSSFLLYVVAKGSRPWPSMNPQFFSHKLWLKRLSNISLSRASARSSVQHVQLLLKKRLVGKSRLSFVCSLDLGASFISIGRK